jgi:hypothetical protein
MRKAKSESADIQHLRSALVCAGLSTYPLAMQAIAEFREEVFSMLERVAKPRKPAISQMVGSTEFKRNSDEVDAFLDGTDTFLSIFTNGASCAFTIYLSWQDVNLSPDLVRVRAGIWCDKRATFEKVTEALQDRFGSKIIVQADDYECCLEKAIQQQQIGKLESDLGTVCDAWIRMLRTVNFLKLIRSKQ